ncbi:MAG: DNA-formamidopyrimidine glycosylase family protein [Acidobacteriota bacterium]
MPELPDIELYLHALRPRLVGVRLEAIRLANPFLVRSIDPPLEMLAGHSVTDLRRIGKRIVWGFDHGVYAVFHLMIAGRLRWQTRGARVPGRIGLAAFDFSSGTVILTEAGSTRRASLHVVRGEDALGHHDPGGLDVLTATPAEFAEAMRRENHTIKRALTDPRLVSGIGNAYSDEILHAARISPVKLTSRLSEIEMARLAEAAKTTLVWWRDHLIAEAASGFPDKVTAFREGMAVHGRYGKPCPSCRTPVQRIRYAANEANYCPSCQTGGTLLADRALSRLLKGDWPRSLEELDEHKAARSR